MTLFKIKQNDTLPILKYQVLNDIDGTPFVLSGSESVKFFLRDENGLNYPVTGSATILDAPNGILQFAFSSIDTSKSGFYEGEFQVTDTGSVLTIPQDRSLYVQIFDDISN